MQEYHLIRGLRKADIQPSRISHLIGYYNEWLPHPVAGKRAAIMRETNDLITRPPTDWHWMEKNGEKRVVDPFDLPDDWRE